ncbi:hypothetical protein BIW11_03868 [Tropilaelaps mercedesae]|uniref:Uncharacterized protein n=1 Tax=Tropilaelaps mercedesae TaxID=418985 RepID=A0A1V9XF38_9ACAR|nr:hypothetical protein BIW11_03868 [Tropilaelaps mercedesae]
MLAISRRRANVSRRYGRVLTYQLTGVLGCSWELLPRLRVRSMLYSVSTSLSAGYDCSCLFRPDHVWLETRAVCFRRSIVVGDCVCAVSRREWCVSGQVSSQLEQE